MTKIVTDQFQTHSGSTFSLPSADGTAGQILTTDGKGNLSFSSGSESEAVVYDAIVPADNSKIIGSVISNSARQNVYSSGEWSSSANWTTYYHSWQDINSKIQGFNMFMGDGYPSGTTQTMHVNDGENAMTRVKEYAHGNRLGNTYKDYFYYDNVTGNYSGVSWRCIPVRNTTNLPITRTFSAQLSSYDASYGGCCIVTYTPNSSVYSTTTAGDFYEAFSGGSNTANASRTGTVTIPANTTILIFINSIHHYETTYRFKDTNMMINLDSFFTGGVVCDLRMLETLATARIGTTSTTAEPYALYPACADSFGDR